MLSCKPLAYPSIAPSSSSSSAHLPTCPPANLKSILREISDSSADYLPFWIAFWSAVAFRMPMPERMTKEGLCWRNAGNVTWRNASIRVIHCILSPQTKQITGKRWWINWILFQIKKYIFHLHVPLTLPYSLFHFSWFLAVGQWNVCAKLYEFLIEILSKYINCQTWPMGWVEWWRGETWR